MQNLLYSIHICHDKASLCSSLLFHDTEKVFFIYVTITNIFLIVYGERSNHNILLSIYSLIKHHELIIQHVQFIKTFPTFSLSFYMQESRKLQYQLCIVKKIKLLF